MADQSRTSRYPLALNEAIEQLRVKPWLFNFYAAVHLFELLHDDKPPQGRAKLPRQDVVRLAHDPSLHFANATLTKLANKKDSKHAVLYSRFLGLIGPNAPLPLHISEYVYNRIHSENDPTLADFLDIFHHRALSLFYRAWADARPYTQAGLNQHDRFGRFLGALSGVGTASYVGRTDWRDSAKQHFAGLLGQQRKTAEYMERLLVTQFSVPMSIKQFVGCWDRFDEESASHLAARNGYCVLGETAVLGQRVWLPQARLRIRVGPLRLRQFVQYLPGGKVHQAMIDIVRQYFGDEFSWDIQLVLYKDEVPAVRLGRQGRLGMTAWIGATNRVSDNDEVVLGPDITQKHAVIV